MSRGARPRTASEVLDLFEQGRVTPAEAFALFRSIEKGQEQSMHSAAPASNLVNAARTKSKEKAEDDEEEGGRRGIDGPMGRPIDARMRVVLKQDKSYNSSTRVWAKRGYELWA